MQQINPNNDRHVKRLFHAVEASRKVMRVHRDKAKEYNQEFVGMHYGEKGARDRTPTNYLQMATSLYVRAFASRSPRVLCTTNYQSLRPLATNLRIITQRAIDKMKLKNTLEEMVTQSMFSMGIVKVGLMRTANNKPYDVGTVFAHNVDFDDWVQDTSAKYEHQVMYEGDRNSQFVRDLIDDPLIGDNDFLLSLPTMEQWSLDDNGEERSEQLSRGSNITDDEGLEDRIEMWDIWLPREQLIVTLESQTGQLVKVVEHDGLDIGPYHKLGYTKVQGNLMPLPPASLIFDLHQLANLLFVKNMRQASLFKKVVVAPPEALKDGELFRQSLDGEYLIAANADRVGEKSFHGADPNTMAMFLEAKNEANRFGGNIDALGGLGPQSETYGQDQLISGAANERLQAMGEKVADVTTGIVKHIAWTLYTDPVTEYRVPKRIPGTDLEIATSVTPEQRSGDFLDFNFDIVAFSMGQRGPAQILQSLRSLVTEFVIPLDPMIQAQGGRINVQTILGDAAEALQYDKLDQLVEFPNNPAPMGPDATEGAGKPAVTTRRYIRTNRAGATTQGRDRAMSNALMGINTQRSERDAAARSPS